MTDERVSQYLLLLELAADLIHPEQYGHAIPEEVRRRVARILKLAPPEIVIPPALLNTEPVVSP